MVSSKELTTFLLAKRGQWDSVGTAVHNSMKSKCGEYLICSGLQNNTQFIHRGEYGMAIFDESAKGVYIIAVTPFSEDGLLDLASTDSMVDEYLASGVTGITILGIMGEATKLTAEESRTFAKRVIKLVNGRVPVVVGASSPGFAPMRELAVSVMDMGAAGVMVAPPSSLRTDDQIYNLSLIHI